MLLNFEPGVVPATENYFELFKSSYFTDVPTLIGDLKKGGNKLFPREVTLCS